MDGTIPGALLPRMGGASGIGTIFSGTMAMLLTMDTDRNEPSIDHIARKYERLRTLLDLGATMENQGVSLHLADLRMDVRGIADMTDEAWREALRSVQDHLGPHAA